MTAATTPTADAVTGRYTTTPTTRILDTRAATRTGLCPTATPACVTIPAAGALTVQVAGQGGVPAGVETVTLNVTAVNPAGPGKLSVYPTGATPVATAHVAYTTAGQPVANTVIAAVAANGQITIAAAQNSVDVTVDVDGWTRPATGGGGGGTYTPLTTARIVDTTNTGTQPACVGTCTRMNPGTNITVQAAGQGGVPAAGVAAVAVNVTVVNPAAAGALTVWASDNATNPPPTRTVEYAADPKLTKLVVVPVTPAGRISINNATPGAATDLYLDVVGWYSTTWQAAANSYHPIGDISLIDATPNPRSCTILQPNVELTRTVTGLPGVPTGTKAAVLNVTAVNGASADTLTVWATGTPRPAIPSMTYRAGQARTTTIIIAPVSTSGNISFYSTGNAGLAVTVVGYYTPAGTTSTVTYTYDNDGLRTTKTAPDTTVTTYRWDKNGPLPLLISETTGLATTRYIYGPGGTPYEQINPDGTATYLHQDQIGSIRALTGPTGTLTGQATYTPYGKPITTGQTTPFGYTGQYTDTETGNQYLRARYYNPNTGQFVSRDPKISVTGDAYAYANGDPVNRVDPAGTLPCWVPLVGDCGSEDEYNWGDTSVHSWYGPTKNVPLRFGFHGGPGNYGYNHISKSDRYHQETLQGNYIRTAITQGRWSSDGTGFDGRQGSKGKFELWETRCDGDVKQWRKLTVVVDYSQVPGIGNDDTLGVKNAYFSKWKRGEVPMEVPWIAYGVAYQ